MTINKLAIIGGSGLYDVEEFKKRELLELDTPWGKPSDKILRTNFKKFEQQGSFTKRIPEAKRCFNGRSNR